MSKTFFSGLWNVVSSRRPFVVCLLFLSSVCVVLVARGSLTDPLPQFELGAQEILHTHRIAWNFLPVGYASLLGWAYVAGAHWGVTGMYVCAMAMHVMLLLLTFVMLHSLLRQASPERFAAPVALMISLYPELIEGVARIGDTDATLLTLLWIVLAIGKLRRAPGVGWAVMSGLAIAFGTLVRPNLALMPLLLAWALWGSAWRRALQLVATSLASTVAVFCLVTMAIHGQPFLPQNGDYNLYAGANPYTEQALLGSYNGEDSVLMDMAARGHSVTLNWLQPANRPGVADIRDAIYQPYYRQLSHAFIREHPGMMLKLAALKLATFLRPDTKRYHFFDAHKSATVMAWLVGRTLEAMEVPAWILLLIWSCVRQWKGSSTLVPLTATIYVLPFLLVNSDPRFRTALDVLLLVEMARMLYQRRCQLRLAHGVN